jgi:hypothetical protein
MRIISKISSWFRTHEDDECITLDSLLAQFIEDFADVNIETIHHRAIGAPQPILDVSKALQTPFLLPAMACVVPRRTHKEKTAHLYDDE